MQTRVIFAIVAVIVIGIGAGLWWWQGSSPPAKQAATEPVPQPEHVGPMENGEVPAAPDAQRAALPALDASDDYVREQVGPLSPSMADWLKQDDLVRRFAAIVDVARQGDYPRRQLAFLTPAAKFPVQQQDDRILLDPAGYQRFDGFVDIATSIEPQRAVGVLRTLSPLLVQALMELGAKDPDPLLALRQSIDQALATPDVEGEIELVQPKVYYQFADAKLEALPPLQKQLIRMGPQNLARIKSYLTQVKSFL